MPGQEDGNVDYVQQEQVGAWAPEPSQVVKTLRKWVNWPEERERIAKNCRRAARPDASRQIARLLAPYILTAERGKAVYIN